MRTPLVSSSKRLKLLSRVVLPQPVGPGREQIYLKAVDPQEAPLDGRCQYKEHKCNHRGHRHKHFPRQQDFRVLASHLLIVDAQRPTVDSADNPGANYKRFHLPSFPIFQPNASIM